MRMRLSLVTIRVYIGSLVDEMQAAIAGFLYIRRVSEGITVVLWGCALNALFYKYLWKCFILYRNVFDDEIHSDTGWLCVPIRNAAIGSQSRNVKVPFTK